MDGMKQIMVEGMEASENIGYRRGLLAAARVVTDRVCLLKPATAVEALLDIEKLMSEATPYEIAAQRVEGASGGDPDPS